MVARVSPVGLPNSDDDYDDHGSGQPHKFKFPVCIECMVQRDACIEFPCSSDLSNCACTAVSSCDGAELQLAFRRVGGEMEWILSVEQGL